MGSEMCIRDSLYTRLPRPFASARRSFARRVAQSRARRVGSWHRKSDSKRAVEDDDVGTGQTDVLLMRHGPCVTMRHLGAASRVSFDRRGRIRTARWRAEMSHSHTRTMSHPQYIRLSGVHVILDRAFRVAFSVPRTDASRA